MLTCEPDMTIEDFRKRFKHEPESIGPDERCAVCGRLAPRKLGISWGHAKHGMLTDTTGWRISFFPWRIQPEGTDFFHEAQRLCPPCGTRVAEYIALLRKPAFDADID